MSKELAQSFYESLADRDTDRLLALVHPDFTGTISDGLPIDATGTIAGSNALINRVWGTVSLDFDVTPKPQEIVGLDDVRLLATGRYMGTARATGCRVDAMFAHVLTFENRRLIGLDQYTDTHRWRHALDAT